MEDMEKHFRQKLYGLKGNI